MLSNSRILAKTTQGQNTVILTQADSAYVLILGTYINTKSRNPFSKKVTQTFKVIAEKIIGREEALLALEQINRLARTESKVTNKQTGILSLSAPAIAPATATRKTAENSEATILLLETSKASASTKKTAKPATPVASPYYPVLEIFLASQMTCAPNKRG